MISRTVQILSLTLIVLAVKGKDLKPNSKCSNCYSQSPDDFLLCVKENCKAEILSKETLFSDIKSLSTSIKCDLCSTKAGEEYSSCVILNCSSEIKAKALDLAIVHPWKLMQMFPMQISSCKTCLETIESKEASYSCTYFSCKLEKSKVLNKSEALQTSCKTCESLSGQDFQNCAFLYCRQENSLVLADEFGTVSPLPNQCIYYCYIKTLKDSSDYFECHAELCGSAKNLIEYQKDLKNTQESRCETCQVLFHGPSLNTCQSVYCNFHQNHKFSKLFAVSPKFESKCAACHSFSDQSLKVCIVQNCQNEFQSFLKDQQVTKKVLCDFPCQEMYEKGILRFSALFDCLIKECEQEVLAIYKFRFASSADGQIYCSHCHSKQGFYDLEKGDQSCAFCYKNILIFNRFNKRVALDGAKSDNDQVEFLREAIMTKDLHNDLAYFVLNDPSVLLNLHLEMLEGQGKYDISGFSYRMSQYKEINRFEKCEPCSKYKGKELYACFNWFCHENMDNKLIKNECAKNYFLVHNYNKKNFLDAATQKCRFTLDEAKLYLIQHSNFHNLPTKIDKTSETLLCSLNDHSENLTICKQTLKTGEKSNLKQSKQKSCKSLCFYESSGVFNHFYRDCTKNCLTSSIQSRNELCDKCWDEYQNGMISKEDYLECNKFYCRVQIEELSAILLSKTEQKQTCDYCSNFNEEVLAMDCIQKYCNEKAPIEKLALMNNSNKSHTFCSKCSEISQENNENLNANLLKQCVQQFCAFEVMQNFKELEKTRTKFSPWVIFYYFALIFSAFFTLVLFSIPFWLKQNKRARNDESEKLLVSI